MNNSVNKEAADAINDLIARNLDASDGFVQVANNINYPNLTKWLVDWGRIHENFANDLKPLVARSGEEPTDDTTVLGDLHHTWVHLKAQWTDNDTEALLDECLRGEETALNDYDEVLNDTSLPSDARQKLTSQRSEIAKAVSDLKFLKEEYHKLEEQDS